MESDQAAQRRRRQQAEAARNRRANETPEQREARLARDRERRRQSRAARSDAERATDRAAGREQRRRSRAQAAAQRQASQRQAQFASSRDAVGEAESDTSASQPSAEAHARGSSQARVRQARRRARLTPEQTEDRRRQDREQHRRRRAELPADEHDAQLARGCQRRRLNQENAERAADEANELAHAGERYQRPTERDLQFFETDPTSALRRFCNSTGFDVCGQAFGDQEERLAALQQHLRPVTPQTAADCLRRFREHVGPEASLGACAACGVAIVAERDWDRHNLDVNGQPPLTQVSYKQFHQLSSLQLSSEQLQAHLHAPAADRPLYSVLEVTNAAGVVMSAYYIHRHLLQPPVNGQQLTESALRTTRVPVCTSCDCWVDRELALERKRRQQGRPAEPLRPPEFSIAAGYDFGAPWWLDLPPLSLAEQKLIALNLRQSHIVKLTGGGQSANTGHVITLEHDDARFAVNRRMLPDAALHGSLQVLLCAFSIENHCFGVSLIELYTNR